MRLDSFSSLWKQALAPVGAVVIFTVGAAAQTLDKAVQRALSDARLGDARVGVMVMDVRTGETLASVREDEPFIPASNMKVLTSGAALAILGPDFIFRTELAVDGDRLIIRGSGDPAMADPVLLSEMGIGADEFLDTWQKAIASSGAGPLREIVLDTRIFDDETIHPSWPIDQLNRWYCAEISGLNFHANLLSVYATPSKPGMAPRIRTEPAANWLTIDNEARTVTAGENTPWIARPLTSNDLKLHGSVRRPTDQAIEVTLHDMPDVLGRLMSDRIDGPGGAHPSVRRAAADEALPEGRTVAVVRTPMDVILKRCNTNSYNLYAEALSKRIGHEITGQPGSWTTGAAALRMVVQQKLGARFASAVVVADGSGMSRENRVTPHLLARWLIAMVQDDHIRPAFLASLPVAAQSGTLRKRFAANKVDHEVRAKTGYISGVSALSGYIADENGEQRVVFSIIVNNVPGTLPMQRVKDFQEKVVLIADEWLDDAAAPAPRTGR